MEAEVAFIKSLERGVGEFHGPIPSPVGILTLTPLEEERMLKVAGLVSSGKAAPE